MFVLSLSLLLPQSAIDGIPGCWKEIAGHPISKGLALSGSMMDCMESIAHEILDVLCVATREEPSTKFKRYLILKKEYDELAEALKNEDSGIRRPRLKASLQKAETDLIIAGDMGFIENILERFGRKSADCKGD